MRGRAGRRLQSQHGGVAGPEPSGQGGLAGSGRGLRGLGPACVVVLQASFANTAPRRRAGAVLEQWVSSVRADVEQVLGVRLAWEHRGAPQVRPEGDGGCTTVCWMLRDCARESA